MKKNIIIALLVILIIVTGIAFAMLTWPGQVAPDISKPIAVVAPSSVQGDQAQTKPTDIGDIWDGPVVVQKNIIVEKPQLNENVASPFIASGKAKGWYFEGEFLVRLLDNNNKELALGHARAQGDWMVDGFVPFKAELIFNPGTAKTGKLVFVKDNPSGLPKYDESFELPISFIANNNLQ